jgi:hypothetical protein
MSLKIWDVLDIRHINDVSLLPTRWVSLEDHRNIVGRLHNRIDVYEDELLHLRNKRLEEIDRLYAILEKNK